MGEFGKGTRWRIPQKDLQEFIHLTEEHLRGALKTIQYPNDENPLTYEQIQGMASGDEPLLIGYISDTMPETSTTDPEGTEVRGYYGAAKRTSGGINRHTVPDTAFSRPPVIFDQEISEQRRAMTHPVMEDFEGNHDLERTFIDLWDERNMDNIMPDLRDELGRILIHELLHGKERVTHGMPQKIKTKPYGFEFTNPDAEWKYTKHPTKKRDQAFFQDAINKTGLLGDMYEYGADGKPVKHKSYTNKNPNYETSPLGKLLDKVIMDYYGSIQESKPNFIGPVQYPFEQIQ